MIDLDETLIHSEDFMRDNKYDFVFEMNNPNIAAKKEVFDCNSRKLECISGLTCSSS